MTNPLNRLRARLAVLAAGSYFLGSPAMVGHLSDRVRGALMYVALSASHLYLWLSDSRRILDRAAKPVAPVVTPEVKP